ncbi:MAG: glycosyltransferase family 4 protein [Faecalicatena sp.]|uniref:glycosyltransferase family 4 protein n=1 Tax=Faecalicatena sp. TaxID=2005360 RepID=UPI0025878651|nr:glycosyltransferase family 4 protein [Faecalicatena sp.]MCI6465954.1 glycosyltransferase family 4 protein [Faecalicatena sp.]MDY5618629.1 glycosyltransferase family 4 protein [Lachnospiraceae bacterium]
MEKKIRLLVTASTFPRWEGDTEPRFVLDLCKALKKYFDVTVLVPACPGAKEREVLEGVQVERYHYFPIHKWESLCYPGAIVPRIKEKKVRVFLVPFLFLGLWGRLSRIAKEYDYVHAHWIIPQGIVQSFFKKPYIVTGHGGDVMELNGGVFKLFKMRVLKRAKHVTVVSEKLKFKLKEMYGIDNAIVQSMGCDISKFSPNKRKENLFNQDGKKVLLFVGRFVEIKGIKYLLKAMEKIDAKLIIVGKGPQEKELKEIAINLKDKVRFIGPQSHDELAITYASSDIFVIPSITLPGGVTEGTPTVITEAMASGLPVVGSISGGIPEVIKDGYNGYLVEEKNVENLARKINVLINDEERYQQFKQGALVTAEKYSYENIAKKYAQIILEDNIDI